VSAPQFTPAPWVATYFTRPDGSPIETGEHVAETIAFSASQSDRAELHGVTLTGDEDGVIVCYTGNGPRSQDNAHLIAAAPELYEALSLFVTAGEMSVFDGGANKAMAVAFDAAERALAKARGETL
jgi:hypothetical protein